jgi:hypothetical protein
MYAYVTRYINGTNKSFRITYFHVKSVVEVENQSFCKESLF